MGSSTGCLGAQLVLERDGRACASFAVTDQLARSWYAPPGTWSARYRGHAGGSYRELGTVTLRVGEPTTIGE